MRLGCIFIVLILIAMPVIHTIAQYEIPPTASRSAMKPFARMVGGEWKMTVSRPASMRDTWHWGPGHHSMRVLTDGLDATGDPWRSLQVVYWNPGSKQVCLINMHPDIRGIGRGVGEGTIRFDGDTAVAVYDLYQPRGRRQLNLRWVFNGPDNYDATLLESTDGASYLPLVSWDYSRVGASTTLRPTMAEEAQKLTSSLLALEALVGHAWQSTSKGQSRDSTSIRTTIEYIPIADYVYARTCTLSDGSESTHTLDAYVYLHVGTSTLHCLALTDDGGVYEGTLRAMDGGLQAVLTGHEIDRPVQYVVRVDFERDETFRLRAWSQKGEDRSLILDANHQALTSKKN